MSIPTVLSFAAVYFSLIIAAMVLLRDKHAFVHRVFATGMFLLAADELCRGLGYRAILPEDVLYWQKRIMGISALIPGVWLAFSVSYARVNSSKSLSRWKGWLIASVAVPLAFVVVFRKLIFTGSTQLEGAARWVFPFDWAGRALQYFFLLASILILFNLERTIRSSTGRMRWQIKFMVLGVGGLFALKIYLASQFLLYSRLDTGIGTTNSVALLAANLMFALSISRARSLNVDVYLSRATIQNSLTLILAGIYLLSAGVAANLARSFLPRQRVPLDALLIFLSFTALAVLIFSDRLRQKIRHFVTRHFSRPVYDYRSIWMELTQRTASLLDIHELSTAISRIVSESLGILSVNVWLLDETQSRLTLAGSTALSGRPARELEKAGKNAPDLIRFLREQRTPIDLEDKKFDWPEEIMQVAPDFFRGSRMRFVIGLHAGGGLVGVMTLNDDRVSKEVLSTEDLILLETLAGQLAASLLNVKLSARLRQSGEVEAFQTVSTFFVHDLKNLASKLFLTMQNLGEHFDNPEFRADALRTISRSLTKINDMCERLSLLRHDVQMCPAECDLNALVTVTLQEFKADLKAAIEQDLQPLPQISVDSEQIQKVMTNLVMNANQAVNGAGLIRVATMHDGNTVGFAVRDNGCGMSQEFMEKSLFRPFQTTKKRGLGIGLFHSKLIVEAHRGRIEVDSTVGKGTEFRVILPVA